MPVDTGDVRALAVIVGAQARVVEALARLDSAEDRRRTGRVQRELLRARLATLSNASDAHGAVVVLPSLDAPAGDPVDRLHEKLVALNRYHTQRVDELRAMSDEQRQALVRVRVDELLARDDDDALERLAALTREV